MHLACLFSNRTTLALTMLAATVCQPAAFCQTQIAERIEPQVGQTNEHVPIASDLPTLATTIQITKPLEHIGDLKVLLRDLGRVHTLERLAAKVGAP